MKRLIGVVLLITLLLAVANTGYSIEYQYAIFQNTEHSDNVTQDEIENSDTIYNAGIQFRLESLDHVSYEAYISGIVSGTRYKDSALEEEKIKGFNGNLLFKPVNTNFTLELFDSYSQVPQNRFITQRVNNIGDVHVYGAIPKYFINFSETSRFTIEYLFNQVDDRDEPETGFDDSSRTVTRIAGGYERTLSGATSVGLFYRKGKTEFELGSGDYEVEDTFVNWSYDRGLTQITFNLGRSESLNTESNQIFESELVELAIVRSINDNSNLSLGMRHGFGQDITFNLTNPAGTVTANDQAGFIGDLQEDSRFNLNYSRSDFLFNFSIGLFYLNSEPVEQTLTSTEEISKGANLTIGFDLAEYMRSSLASDIVFSYGYDKSEFEELNISNEVHFYSLTLNYYPNDKFLVFLGYERRLSEELLSAMEFEENTYVLGFSFSPRGRIEDF